MKILFIGPLPDPITGHSLACKILLTALAETNDVRVVNLSKTRLTSGFALGRVFSVGRVLNDVWRDNREVDAIYFTISESILGNLKDLLIYFICYPRLSRMVVHLHGGSLKRDILDKYRVLRILNTLFLRRIGGAIVSGPSHVPIFRNIVTANKIHIVPNFAEDHIFTAETHILEKHRLTDKVRILYLSHLIPGKGYQDIVAAYLALPENMQRRIAVEFVGAFDSVDDKRRFLRDIAGVDNITYHGTVDERTKVDLLHRAHILCLPTRFYEGQPLAILEAYAAGCVVITTNRGGIPDIFQDSVNGFSIAAETPHSLCVTLEHILHHPDKLMPIAIHNFRAAQVAYRSSRFSQDVARIVSEMPSEASVSCSS